MAEVKSSSSSDQYPEPQSHLLRGCALVSQGGGEDVCLYLGTAFLEDPLTVPDDLALALEQCSEPAIDVSSSQLLNLKF